MKVRIQRTPLRHAALAAVWHQRVLLTDPIGNVFLPRRWSILEPPPEGDGKPRARRATFAEASFFHALLDAGLIRRSHRRFRHAEWSPWIMVPTADGRALITAWDIREERDQ